MNNAIKECDGGWDGAALANNAFALLGNCQIGWAW
jgi:hypothetical protein